MARRAVIDVGTNSVKVLVADVEGAVVLPAWETSVQTRLGRGFYETHQLQEEPIRATAEAVARFAVEARQRGATHVRVIATSAARDAVNREDLLGAIRGASGIETEVISGETEAELGFRGVMTDPVHAGHPILIVDVGGGSTEFILGSGGRLAFRRSFPLGSVRLHERFRPVDPPAPGQLPELRGWLAGFLRSEVAPGLEGAMAGTGRPAYAVGVGGTTSILAMMRAGMTAFDREAVEGSRFAREEVCGVLEALWSEPLAVRRLRKGLPPERADVIPFGVAIYESVLEVFGIGVLAVSTRGLRFAAVQGDVS